MVRLTIAAHVVASRAVAEADEQRRRRGLGRTADAAALLEASQRGATAVHDRLEQVGARVRRLERAARPHVRHAMHHGLEVGAIRGQGSLKHGRDAVEMRGEDDGDASALLNNSKASGRKSSGGPGKDEDRRARRRWLRRESRQSKSTKV